MINDVHSPRFATWTIVTVPAGSGAPPHGITLTAYCIAPWSLAARMYPDTPTRASGGGVASKPGKVRRHHIISIEVVRWRPSYSWDYYSILKSWIAKCECKRRRTRAPSIRVTWTSPPLQMLPLTTYHLPLAACQLQLIHVESTEGGCVLSMAPKAECEPLRCMEREVGSAHLNLVSIFGRTRCVIVYFRYVRTTPTLATEWSSPE